MPTATRAGWSGREETKDDLRELSEWDGGSIAHNLKLRWERGKRFTYLGPALIALGPEGQPPPPPLAPEERRQYRTCNAVDLDPHPYGVCGAALWALHGGGWSGSGSGSEKGRRRGAAAEEWHSQTVMVSGEAGSGKSSIAWGCIDFLATETGGSRAMEMADAAKRLVEAFTCTAPAPSCRPASSQGLLYARLFFEPSRSGPALCGMRFECSLMDFNRALGRGGSKQGSPQSFNVIHQLLGSPAEVRRRYCVEEGEEGEARFPLFAGGGGGADPPLEKAPPSLADTESALLGAGLDRREVSDIFGLIGAAVNLAHVDFRSSSPDELSKDFGLDVVDERPLEAAASLLSCSPHDLRSTILTECVPAGSAHNLVTMPASLDQAAHYRDALCRELYRRAADRAFAALNSCADHSGPEVEGRAHVGILDGLGFDTRAKICGLELMCRHFTEEILLAKFVSDVACSQAVACARLGLHCAEADEILPDNVSTIRSFDGPSGAFEILRAPPVDDRDFIRQAARSNGYTFIRTRSDSVKFIVKHSAGDLRYTAQDLLRRNSNSCTVDLLSRLSAASDHPLLPGSGASSPREKMDAWSAGALDAADTGCTARVHAALSGALARIEATGMHHIRCIRCRGHGAERADVAAVERQVRYCGLSPALLYWRAQYPRAMDKGTFFSLYEGLPGVIGTALAGAGGATAVSSGAILLSEAIAADFEQRRRTSVEWAACVIQRAVRAFLWGRWERRRRIALAREEIESKRRVVRSALQRQESENHAAEVRERERLEAQRLRDMEHAARIQEAEEEGRRAAEAAELELAKLQAAREQRRLRDAAAAIAREMEKASAAEPLKESVPDRAICRWRLDLMSQEEIMSLMSKPLPPASEVRCRVVRGSGGGLKRRLYPSHDLYLEALNSERDPQLGHQQFMMRACRRSLKSGGFTVTCSPVWDGQSDMMNRIGEVKGRGGQFALSNEREERILTVDVGDVSSGDKEVSRTVKAAAHNVRGGMSCILTHQRPRWDEKLMQYVLDFPDDRPVLSSVKNLILRTKVNLQIEEALRFGRAAENEFILDIAWPLSPLQGFGIAIAAIESSV